MKTRTRKIQQRKSKTSIKKVTNQLIKKVEWLYNYSGIVFILGAVMILSIMFILVHILNFIAIALVIFILNYYIKNIFSESIKKYLGGIKSDFSLILMDMKQKILFLKTNDNCGKKEELIKKSYQFNFKNHHNYIGRQKELNNFLIINFKKNFLYHLNKIGNISFLINILLVIFVYGNKNIPPLGFLSLFILITLIIFSIYNNLRQEKSKEKFNNAENIYYESIKNNNNYFIYQNDIYFTKR